MDISKNFTDKYSRLLDDISSDKKNVKKVIHDCVGITLDILDIEINNKEVSILTNSVYKFEILQNKEEINKALHDYGLHI